MELSVTHGHTLTEEEAVAEIVKLGLNPIVADVPPAENEFHWHDFDSVFYVLEGSLDVTEHETGETKNLPKGTRVSAPRGVIHREKHNGFRGAFGFSVKPEELVFPLEKAPPVTA